MSLKKCLLALLLLLVTCLGSGVNASAFSRKGATYESTDDGYHEVYSKNGNYIKDEKCKPKKWKRFRDEDGDTGFARTCKYCDYEVDVEYDDIAEEYDCLDWKSKNTRHTIRLTQRNVNLIMNDYYNSLHYNDPYYDFSYEQLYSSGIKSVKTIANRKGAIYSRKYSKGSGMVSFKLKYPCTVTHIVKFKSGAVCKIEIEYE